MCEGEQLSGCAWQAVVMQAVAKVHWNTPMASLLQTAGRSGCSQSWERTTQDCQKDVFMPKVSVWLLIFFGSRKSFLNKSMWKFGSMCCMNILHQDYSCTKIFSLWLGQILCVLLDSIFQALGNRRKPALWSDACHYKYLSSWVGMLRQLTSTSPANGSHPSLTLATPPSATKGAALLCCLHMKSECLKQEIPPSHLSTLSEWSLTDFSFPQDIFLITQTGW